MIPQPHWPQWPLQARWPQQPLNSNILKKPPDPDVLIITGTKITITGNVLWNESQKIQFFTNIWHPFWQRPLRPHEVKKVSNGGSGINSHYSGSHWASVFGRFVKTSGQASLYFISIPNGWPCRTNNWWRFRKILFGLKSAVYNRDWFQIKSGLYWRA